MKRISRKAFLAGGATAAAAAAAGVCLCTKTGWATISGVGATPDIAHDAYDVVEDKSIRIRLDRAPELALVGGSVKILASNIGDSLIVARIAEDVYVAASIKCTHRGVEVEYRADDKCFKCASLGGSRFKTDGEKIRGFAKGPLKTYPVSSEGNILVIRSALDNEEDDVAINFQCKKCQKEFDCEMGKIGINEQTLRPDFEKPIICPRCGKRTMDEVLLTELGQSQMTEATMNL